TIAARYEGRRIEARRPGEARWRRSPQNLRRLCSFCTGEEDSMLSKTSVTGIVCLAFGIGASLGGAGCAGEEPADGAPEVAAESRAVDDYAATKYPIVLMPGIFGFRTMLGIVDYFPGI